MALAAAALHSLSDYSMHIPANAAIVTVLCAHLCAASRCGSEAGARAIANCDRDNVELAELRLAGVAPILGALAAVALGMVVASECWKAVRTEQLQRIVLDPDLPADMTIRASRVAAVEGAIESAMDPARLHADAARAYLAAFEGSSEGMGTGLGGDGTGSASVTARARAPDPDRERSRRTHLVLGLRHLLRSRDLCPVGAETQMEIAEHRDEFEEAEPRAAYLERALFLRPDAPSLWERRGALELRDDRPDRAWASWRHSLELSDRHLSRILARSAEHLGPHDIARYILPDRPDLLLKASQVLFPRSVEGRRPFLQRALSLLEARRGPPAADDLHVRATIRRALGQPAEAISDYRACLERAPLELMWRYELAELLFEQGRARESHRELLKIQVLQPDNGQARALMDAVRTRLAEGG
jgi:tetratricopeptide (TPR) repeat protein